MKLYSTHKLGHSVLIVHIRYANYRRIWCYLVNDQSNILKRKPTGRRDNCVKNTTVSKAVTLITTNVIATLAEQKRQSPLF